MKIVCIFQNSGEYINKGEKEMKRNALVPYFLIMAFGIGLIFALSFIGMNGGEQAGDGGGATTQTPEEIYATSCITCHGENYEGKGNYPALKGVGERLSKEEIKEVIVKGRTGDIGTMPGGMVPAESVDAMVDWLSTLE